MEGPSFYPGWSGAALTAVALAVTACGTGSGQFAAGGAYGYGNQTTQAPAQVGLPTAGIMTRAPALTTEPTAPPAA